MMFSLYKTSEEIVDSKISTQNEETDNEEEEEDISIEDQLHKLCKLRIGLCRLTDKRELEYASDVIDTELIEESEFTVLCVEDRVHRFRSRSDRF